MRCSAEKLGKKLTSKMLLIKPKRATNITVGTAKFIRGIEVVI